MERLISGPGFDDAFDFGRRTVGRILEDCWWYYALLAIAGALLTAANATPLSFRTVYVGWLAFIPALANATRYAIPSFRMSPKRALPIAGFLLAELAVPIIVVFSILHFAMQAPALFFFAFPILATYWWIVVRVSLTPAMHSLRNGEVSIISAMGDSWSVAAGAIWWESSCSTCG